MSYYFIEIDGEDDLSTDGSKQYLIHSQKRRVTMSLHLSLKSALRLH